MQGASRGSKAAGGPPAELAARKAGAKQLLASFLEAFPGLAAHRTALVDEALDGNGCVLGWRLPCCPSGLCTPTRAHAQS